jgi:hypothetical protein
MPNDAGKGSAPRPFSVDKKTFDENWEKIFVRHEKIKKEVEYYQDLLSTEECVEEALKKLNNGSNKRY